MNCIPKILEMIGVGIRERFNVETYPEDCVFWFDDEGLCSETLVNTDHVFRQILDGTYKIIKIPFYPAPGMLYYYVDCEGEISDDLYLDETLDVFNIKLGNCYQTVESAEDDRERWVHFFSTQNRKRIEWKDVD